MHAAGRNIATWPQEIVSRLAHLDSVTARGRLVDGGVRSELEGRVLALLRDEQIVGVVVATLDDDALALLAGLVRDETAAESPAADGLPSQSLRDCGLAFGDTQLWAPVELQYRLDGVLRAFGV